MTNTSKREAAKRAAQRALQDVSGVIQADAAIQKARAASLPVVHDGRIIELPLTRSDAFTLLHAISEANRVSLVRQRSWIADRLLAVMIANWPDCAAGPSTDIDVQENNRG